MKNNFWKQVWDSKGKSNSDDLLYLDGYEHLNIPFNSEMMVKQIIEQTGIIKSDKVLEVGCAAGFLGREFTKFCCYEGIDYSEGLIEKHKKLFNNRVFCMEAMDLNFPTNYFDKIFAYGVFQYFPDKTYSEGVFIKMIDMAKDAIFIGDLKVSSDNDKHLTYEKDEFEDLCKFYLMNKCTYKVTDCLYNPSDKNRFNIVVKK